MLLGQLDKKQLKARWVVQASKKDFGFFSFPKSKVPSMLACLPLEMIRIPSKPKHRFPPKYITVISGKIAQRQSNRKHPFPRCLAFASPHTLCSHGPQGLEA